MADRPRRPNFVRFIATGAILGVIAGGLLFFAADGDLNQPGAGTSFSVNQAVGYFSLLFGLLGALAGAVVGVLSDRRR